jgi:hypothetical protein
MTLPSPDQADRNDGKRGCRKDPGLDHDRFAAEPCNNDSRSKASGFSGFFGGSQRRARARSISLR